MAQTDVTFSAVDFVENLRKALGYPIPSILEENIKGMFDDAGFTDFKDKLRADMENKVWERILKTMDVDGINNESTHWYLYEVITENMDIWNTLANNHDNIISEILHDASGYLGQNLSDADFDDFRGFVDEEVSVLRHIQIMVGKKLGRPFEENSDLINQYAISKGISPNIFYPKKETAKVNNTEVAVVNCKATEVCTLNIERNVTYLTYAILNTSNYDGGMGATIVKCCTPIALEEYGFDNAECVGISLLKVGELYTSTDYGNGVVVVRMS